MFHLLNFIQKPFRPILCFREVLNKNQDEPNGRFQQLNFKPFALLICIYPLNSDTAVECLWKTSHFRGSIKEKLEEMIRLIPDHKRADLGSSIDPNAIEQFLFSSSKTKDEYLELTARVIVHFKHLHNVETKEGTSKRKVEDDQLETLQSKRIKVKE